MTTSRIWACAAFGVGLLAAGSASAQDMGRDYFQQRADRAADGETISLRWTLPLGDRADSSAAPRLALRFSQANAEGDLRSMDLVSYSFGDRGRVETPFTLNAGEGPGGWIARHPVLSVVGAGLIIWAVVEATDDDDEEDAPPQNQ